MTLYSCARSISVVSTVSYVLLVVISLRNPYFFSVYIGVGAKSLNNKKLEWPKSRNSKLSKFKCRKAIITNDFKVLNTNLRTQRCRKKFKSKANIRILEITKGEITSY